MAVIFVHSKRFFSEFGKRDSLEALDFIWARLQNIIGVVKWKASLQSYCKNVLRQSPPKTSTT